MSRVSAGRARLEQKCQSRVLRLQALRTRQNLPHTAAHTHVHLALLSPVAMERVTLSPQAGFLISLSLPLSQLKSLLGPWSFPNPSLLNPQSLAHSFPLRLDHSHHHLPHLPWSFAHCSNSVFSLDSRAEVLRFSSDKNVDDGALDKPKFPLSRAGLVGLPGLPLKHLLPTGTSCFPFGGQERNVLGDVWGLLWERRTSQKNMMSGASGQLSR